MANLIRDQDRWKHSVQWLEDERQRKGQTQETIKAIDEALTNLDSIAWNTELTSSQLPLLQRSL